MTLQHLVDQFQDNQHAVAILRVLERVSPEYLTRHAIRALVQVYENANLTNLNLGPPLKLFEALHLVESEINTRRDIVAVKARLVAGKKIKADDYDIPSGYGLAFKATPTGLELSVALPDVEIAPGPGAVGQPE